MLSAVESGNETRWSEKLLKMCALKENEIHLTSLFNSLKDNELLRYRIYSLHKIMSDPQLVFNFIAEHQKRVEWQIRRIYRARNSIVHSGTSPTFLESIVDNAHDYFDQILQFTVDASCGSSGFTTFSSCFEFFDWEYEKYIHRIKAHKITDEKTVRAYIWKRTRPVSREDILIPNDDMKA